MQQEEKRGDGRKRVKGSVRGERERGIQWWRGERAIQKGFARRDVITLGLRTNEKSAKSSDCERRERTYRIPSSLRWRTRASTRGWRGGERHQQKESQIEAADGHLEAGVRGKIKPVEARMTLGELSRLARLLEREASWSVRTLQVLEAVDGDPRRAGDELEQTTLLLRRPRLDRLPRRGEQRFAAGETERRTFQNHCTTSSPCWYPR